MTVEKAPAKPGDVVLDVVGLSVIDAVGVPQVRNVSFDVRAGEILAIAGVQGNGQTELTEALLGLTHPVAGYATLDGERITGRSIKEVLMAGIGFVPEDRTEDGIVSTFTLENNLILDLHDQEPFATRHRPADWRDRPERHAPHSRSST